jgi:hypothetical protein
MINDLHPSSTPQCLQVKCTATAALEAASAPKHPPYSSTLTGTHNYPSGAHLPARKHTKCLQVQCPAAPEASLYQSCQLHRLLPRLTHLEGTTGHGTQLNIEPAGNRRQQRWDVLFACCVAMRSVLLSCSCCAKALGLSVKAQAQCESGCAQALLVLETGHQQHMKLTADSSKLTANNSWSCSCMQAVVQQCRECRKLV